MATIRHPLAYHPAAALFPMMDPAAFTALRRDISEHGQLEPVVLHQGKIVDGRNRYRALRELGVEPACTSLPEGADPIAFVVSANLHRRHLTASQRAMVGVAVKEAMGEAAAQRRRRGLPHDLAEGPRGDTRELAANLLNVGHGVIDKASHVASTGVPALQSLVVQGQLSVDAAAVVAQETPSAQQQILASGGASGARRFATSQRRKRKAALASMVPEPDHPASTSLSALLSSSQGALVSWAANHSPLEDALVQGRFDKNALPELLSTIADLREMLLDVAGSLAKPQKKAVTRKKKRGRKPR